MPDIEHGLTAPQADLLSSLHNTDHGSLYLVGRDLVTVRRLVALDYATADGQRWHSITPAGREAHMRRWRTRPITRTMTTRKQ